MVRKITGNMLVGLLMPILVSVRWWPNIYNGILYNKYEYYDFHIESLEELLNQIYSEYFLTYVLSLVFFLLPFQLIKDRYYKKRGIGLALWKKSLLFSGIIVLLFLLFFRAPITQMYMRIIVFGSILAIGTFISLLLYLIVDRYVERCTVEEN